MASPIVSTMDHPFSFNSYVPFIIAFLTFVIMAIQRYNKKINSNKTLPPGPRTLPIIGNLHQLISPLPHRRLASLSKKYGLVMYLKLGQVPCVVVSSTQAAEEVLRTKDISFAHRPATFALNVLTYNCKDIGFTPYGEYWRQMRKIFVVHLASAKQVASFRPVREAEVSTFVGSIADLSRGGNQVNLSKMFYSVSTSIISKATFGDSCKRVDAFTALLPRIIKITTSTNIAEFFPSVRLLQRINGFKKTVMKIHQEIDEVLESVIAEYRESEKAGKTEENNILGVLLSLQNQGGPDGLFSMDSIKAILFDVFAAGIENAATILEWTMSELMKHPEVMKKVQAEIRQCFCNKSTIDEESLHQLKYMDAVIKESFRLHPPAPLLFPREARECATINGYEIHPKTRVFVNAWAIGRDPEIWTDAEKFYPERFLNTSIDYKGSHLEFIPFGAGRRICPGMMFAMVGIEIILANLLYHFTWELPDGLSPDCLDMDEVMGGVVQKKHHLCLVPTKYRPYSTGIMS